MSQPQLDIPSCNTAFSRFDTVIEWLMIALLAFMPLAFGAVAAWSEQVVIILTGAMATCFALKLVIRKDSHLIWTWAYVPVALFLILAVVQLLPLPVSLIKILSPETAATKTTLLGNLPNAADILNKMTLSFYPQATRHNLRLILAIAIVFVITVNIYRRDEQITRLLSAIAIIGGGLALLALLQNLIGNGKIYWIFPTHGKGYSGTFVNHSHYGQFMNLSMGAALGFLLVKLHKEFGNKKVALPEIVTRLGETDFRMAWFCIGTIILGAATVFISLTRGGMVSMLIAGGFTVVILAFKRGLEGRSWIITAMALGSFICVLHIGFDAVYERLATLSEFDRAEGGRWEIVKDISVAWMRFPLFGAGLGSHDVVYPMFDRSTFSSLAGHAENEYAQIAEETGAIGLGLMLVLIAIVWRNYVKNVRHIGNPIHFAAFGLGFGLLAIMIHSFSDFGQHLPANACLTAVSCGLLVGMGRRITRRTGKGTIAAANSATDRKNSPGQLYRLLRFVVAICVVAIWIWAITGANNARCAESYWKEVLRNEESLTEKNWLGSNEQYADILSPAMKATDYQPDNARYRHWLNVYRWRSISRVTDPDTGQLIVTPETLEFTRRIVDDLHQTRVLCPTFGATYCVAGQLEYFILNNPKGADHIRTGYKLAPCDATSCFVAGLLDIQEGDVEASMEKFQRAVELNGRLFRDVVDVYVFQAKRPDLAVSMAQDNIGWLSQVARILSESAEHHDLTTQARAEVVRLLKDKCQEPDVRAGALASLAGVYVREENYEAATDYYRQALVSDYSNTGWRLALARTLARMDKVPEAIHEARICLRLRPQMKAATKLIEHLSILPKQSRKEVIGY